MNSVNTKLEKENAIATLVDTDNFLSLETDLQNKIIESIAQENTQKGGIMGKFLGLDSTNVSMHIALILCGLLIILLVIDFIHSYLAEQNINMDLVSTIIPVITLSLGYIFGKGSN